MSAQNPSGRKAYRSVAYLEEGKNARQVEVIVVVDPDPSRSTTSVYLIPISEFSGKGEVEKFIKEANNKGLRIGLNFPFLHSHTTFDGKLKGFARFARTLDESERMLRRSRDSTRYEGSRHDDVKENLTERKLRHGKEKDTHAQTARLLATAKTLRSQVSSARVYNSSYLEELRGLQQEAKRIRISDQHWPEFNSICQEIYQYIQRLKDEEGRRNGPKIRETVARAVEAANSQSTDFKAIREQLKAAQEELKATSLPREEKDRLWKRLNEAFEVLKRRQERQGEIRRSKQAVEFDRIKGLLEAVTQTIGVTSDLKGAKQRLIAVQAELKAKGADLSKEQKDLLFGRIKTAFEIINRRMNEERQQREQYANRAYDALSRRISSAASTVAYTTDFRSAREELATIKRDIFAVDGMDKSKRSQLLGRVNSLFETINQRQKEARDVQQREHQRRQEEYKRQKEERDRKFREQKAEKDRKYKEQKERRDRERRNKKR